jgi:hypothetical protein
VRLVTQRTHTFIGNCDDWRRFMIAAPIQVFPWVFMVISDIFPFGLRVPVHTFVSVAARAESSPYVQALDPIAAVVGHTNGVATTKADGEALDA